MQIILTIEVGEEGVR